MRANNSFSKFNTFSTLCEKQYGYEVVRGRKVDAKMQKIFDIGHDVHDTLEAICTAMSQGVDLNVAIDKRVKARILSDEDIDDYVSRARPILAHLTPRKGGVESWVSLDLGPRPFKGKIDLISETIPEFDSMGNITGSREGLCVIDWKTTRNPDKIRREKDCKNALQLQTYSLAASELLGEEVSTAGFVTFLPPGYLPAAGAVVTFTPEALARAQRWLSLTAETIERRWEQFDASDEDFSVFSLASTDNFLCSKKWCPFFGECLGKVSE